VTTLPTTAEQRYKGGAEDHQHAEEDAMTTARLSSDPTKTYVLLNYTPDGHAVLLDSANERTAFQESSGSERVEVRCDRCGDWTTFAVRAAEGWQCYRHLSEEAREREPVAAGARAATSSRSSRGLSRGN
jgi:hypothetical protein